MKYVISAQKSNSFDVYTIHGDVPQKLCYLLVINLRIYWRWKSAHETKFTANTYL